MKNLDISQKWESNLSLINAVFTIERGRIKQIINHFMVIDKQEKLIELKYDNKTIETLRKDEADIYIQQITAMARTKNTYATFQDFPLFNLFYPIQKNNILYDLSTPMKEQETRTCINCAIILPDRLLQMDHQRPQIGGEIEAIAKNLRVLNLTEGPAKGPKCKTLQALFDYTKKYGNTPLAWFDIFIFPNKFETAWKVMPKPERMEEEEGKEEKEENLNKRYTLNKKGALLYSLLVLFGGEKSLEAYSVNSIMNIRPLCSSCNGGRSNKDLKFK